MGKKRPGGDTDTGTKHDDGPSSKRPKTDIGPPPPKSGAPGSTSPQGPGALAPPPKGGSGFQITPAHFDTAGGGMDKAAGRMQAAQDKLSGVIAAKGDFMQKDSLGAAFAKVFQPMADGHGRAGQTLRKSVAQTGDGLRANGTGIQKAEDRNAQRVSGVKPKGATGRDPQGGGGSSGSQKTPPRTYYVDDNGRVQRVENGRLVPLDATDNGPVRRILNPDGTVRERRVNQTRTNRKTRVRTTEFLRDPVSGNRRSFERQQRADEGRGFPKRSIVPSQQLTEPTDLSRAVEDTRRARDADPNTDGYNRGENYASMRYSGEDGEFILVGHSGDNRSHSERSIGTPFVHNNMQYDVNEVYTEREPCQSGRRGINCERWLTEHFYDPERNTDLKVTHAEEYKSKEADQEKRNAPFGEYMDRLEADHGRGDYSGTAGRRR